MESSKRAERETDRSMEREELRERIVEAARDIVSEEGLDGLSMRALGLRIGHSPGTIYLHFQDKDELLRTVMAEGFKRLGACVDEELERAEDGASSLQRFGAMGRGYARFALENTGYFRSMFKVPGVAYVKGCPEGAEPAVPEEAGRKRGVEFMRRAMESGEAAVEDPERAAVVGWGLIHGLTSLYLSGHLHGQVGSNQEFMELIESAIEALGRGWLPR